eukprot:9469609-Pyramimonas_sp.AAC.1
MAQPGWQGGQSAVQIDQFAELPDDRHTRHDGQQFWNPSFKDDAERDLRGIRATMKRLAYRKSVPPWSLPAEVFRMLINPATRDP